jgi:hypothetical protein
MSYNFIKFEDKHGRYETRISVTGSYSIGFPTKFYADNGIDKYNYVVLYWDADSKAIGIQFSNNEEELGRIKIVKARDYGGMVAVKSFFTKHEIDPKVYKGKYQWEKIEQPGVGEVYVIKLEKKV